MFKITGEEEPLLSIPEEERSELDLAKVVPFEMTGVPGDCGVRQPLGESSRHKNESYRKRTGEKTHSGKITEYLLAIK